MRMLSLKRAADLDAPPDAAPSMVLAVLLGEVDGWFRARTGGVERLVAADPTVDPELLRDAIRSGARVVLETCAAGAPVIVGALATARALTIDRSDAIVARVRRVALTATEEALLAGPGAFVRAREGDVELYGRRVISRARELCRILGRMVKIN